MPTEYLKAHVSIEAPHLGAYGALLTVFAEHGGDVIARYRIPLADLESLFRNMATSVLPSEHERQLQDAVAGHCEVCKDTRMVKEPGPGGARDWTVHCPVCTPRLDAAHQQRRRWPQ